MAVFWPGIGWKDGCEYSDDMATIAVTTKLSTSVLSAKDSANAVFVPTDYARFTRANR
jgi:hypothetical protein